MDESLFLIFMLNMIFLTPSSIPGGKPKRDDVNIIPPRVKSAPVNEQEQLHSSKFAFSFFPHIFPPQVHCLGSYIPQHSSGRMINYASDMDASRSHPRIPAISLF